MRNVPNLVMAPAFILLLLAVLLPCATASAQEKSASAPAAAPAWRTGLWADANFFPVAVWLQPPKRAKDYKAAGVNLYVGLWKGPTEAQLATLKEARLPVICEWNDVAIRDIRGKDPIIVGWLQGDEPDIAHAHAWEDLRTREKPSETFGAMQPPVHPDRVVRDYKLIHAIDPTRPVFTSFSLAVAYGDYVARGNRKNHPEDFPEYLKGLDIAAFDIYPGIHQYTPANGKYWTIAKGTRQLVEWTRAAGKAAWVDIEAMAPRLEHSPHTMKAEVWMAIVHGAQGINYYVHQNASGRLPIPAIEDSVFTDGNMLTAFTETNKLLNSLAPVLNSPAVGGGVKVSSSVPASKEVADAGLEPIAAMVKKHAGATYLFAVRMEDSPATGAFELKGLPAKAKAEVLGENRSVEIDVGKFTDSFQGMDAHIYRVAP